MFDRFTDRAKRVLSLSREAALRLQHGHIDAEHVLVGLIEEGTGVAANVLQARGIELDALQAELEKTMRASSTPPADGKLPFTANAKRLLELALDEASALGHDYIGTEHLLLGALRVGAAGVDSAFRRFGVRLDAVRAGVVEFVGSDGDAPGTPMASRARRVRTRYGIDTLRGSAVVVIPPGEPFDRLHADVIAPALHAAGVDEIWLEPVPFASTEQALDEDRLQELILRLMRAELAVVVAAGGDVADAYVLGLCHGLLHGPIVLSAAGATRPAPFAQITPMRLECDPAALDAAASAELRERITAMARERRGAS